jgi:hypothetical protein
MTEANKVTSQSGDLGPSERRFTWGFLRTVPDTEVQNTSTVSSLPRSERRMSSDRPDDQRSVFSTYSASSYPTSTLPSYPGTTRSLSPPPYSDLSRAQSQRTLRSQISGSMSYRAALSEPIPDLAHLEEGRQWKSYTLKQEVLLTLDLLTKRVALLTKNMTNQKSSHMQGCLKAVGPSSACSGVT